MYVPPASYLWLLGTTSSLQDSGQSVSQSLGRLLGCKSLFLSEKSLTASEVLPFVDATLGVGRARGAAADREMHTLTPTRIPDYARTL